MFLQQDSGQLGGSGRRTDPRTGDPPAPRWLAVLGLAIVLTLVGALARYAIDLLGIVFLIIVVGFSLRAISDWLTEGDSVSGWSIGAVAVGFAGTMAVATWLFGSTALNPHAPFTGYLPPRVVDTITWLEMRGWGQRVLLRVAPDATDPRIPRPGEPTPAQAAIERPPIEDDPSFSIEPRGSSRSRRPNDGRASREPGTAEASDRPDGASPERPRAQSPNPDPVPLTAPDAVLETATVLELASPRVRVGATVRLVATVRARGSRPPEGTVVFYRGDSVMGSARLRPRGDAGVATFSTSDLPVGVHALSAQYPGSRGFASSRSAVVHQVVTGR